MSAGIEAAQLRVGHVVQQDDPLDPLGGRMEDVAEGEDAGIVDHDVDLDSFAAGEVVQLLRGAEACQVGREGDDAPSGLRCPFADGAGRLFERRLPVAGQYEVVSQGGQPQRVAASDARAGSGDQRPGAARGDGPAACGAAGGVGAAHGRRLSSSTILRGRSGQCLQHFMSTEYIRAMQ